jgi:hypothetical protein
VSTPSVTPAQILGLITAFGGLAVAYGLIGNHTEQLVVAAVAAAVGIAFKLADAIIRHGRSRALTGYALAGQRSIEPGGAGAGPTAA